MHTAIALRFLQRALRSQYARQLQNAAGRKIYVTRRPSGFRYICRSNRLAECSFLDLLVSRLCIGTKIRASLSNRIADSLAR